MRPGYRMVVLVDDEVSSPWILIAVIDVKPIFM
jgi:hypothetical protein